MRKIFVYNSSIFQQEILIVIDTPYKKLKDWIIKKAEKPLVDLFKEDEIKEQFNISYDGAVHHFNTNGNDYYIFNFRNFKDAWNKYELLLHEIVHLKQYFFRNRSVEDEDEFEAYFIQNTFREIRQLIYDKYLTK
jgi:hypothetical protein